MQRKSALNHNEILVYHGRKNENYINLKSMMSGAKGMNSATCDHFTSSDTYSLMEALSAHPAGLLQQPSHCKQSTLPQISSSPAVLPVNRTLPLEVQFTVESVACSCILSPFWRQCRVL